MCKSHYVALSSFFLCASIAFNGGADCLTPSAADYTVDLGKAPITIYPTTLVSYSLPGQELHGHTINELFFLGRYTKGSDLVNLHLFCREIDATTGTEVDADLGCVQGVLDEGKLLYVSPTDPKLSMHIDSHYPVRYVTNTLPSTQPSSTNTRVEVKGAGKGIDGVHVTDQG